MLSIHNASFSFQSPFTQRTPAPTTPKPFFGNTTSSGHDDFDRQSDIFDEINKKIAELRTKLGQPNLSDAERTQILREIDALTELTTVKLAPPPDSVFLRLYQVVKHILQTSQQERLELQQALESGVLTEKEKAEVENRLAGLLEVIREAKIALREAQQSGEVAIATFNVGKTKAQEN
jgi:hypothetical protein